jgi:hypothetical protein
VSDPTPYKDVEIARLEERIKALRDIIDKDIVEVRRRLDELNHEHARNMERNKEYLASPLFYQYRDSMEKGREEINKVLANQAGRSAAYVSLVGIFFLIVQVFLHYWK